MAVNLPPAAELPAIAGVRIACARAIKSKRRDDLTVMTLAPGCAVAAVFTQNRFPAAPVAVCREHLRAGGGVRALAINAGIANAGTLTSGLKDARECCRLLARLAGCRPRQVLPFSTGVIMERLPMQKYAAGLAQCARDLQEDRWPQAARAIMTTDTVAKGAARRTGGFTITGIAKGSGMIHPNMATMLAFVAADAAVDADTLRRWQRQIARDTFNAVSVDGDTSTNDSFVLIATGKAGAPKNAAARRALKNAIHAVCEELAEAIVRDGEGAGKFITIDVRGGGGRAACRRVAEAVARSPLVKTALGAGDANVGRILMAIGNAGGGFAAGDVELHIGDEPVIKGGGMHPRYCEARVAAVMAADEISLRIRIGGGKHQARLKTCDLTRAYIDINADYRS